MLKPITTIAAALILLPATLFAQTTQPWNFPNNSIRETPFGDTFAAGGAAADAISQGRQKAIDNAQRLQNQLLFDLPKDKPVARALAQGELGAWWLCLAKDPDKKFLEGSIAANREALKVLDHVPDSHSYVPFRVRSFLVAGLLLSPRPAPDPKPAQPEPTTVDLELKRLLKDASGKGNKYDALWQPGPGIGFANTSAFKEILKQAIIECEASFLVPQDRQPADGAPHSKAPDRALAMAAAAHFWMLMPCADREEKIQYLQKARAACTAALAALPADTPTQDYVNYHLFAAECWSAGDSHRPNMITAIALLEKALGQAPKLQQPLLTAYIIDRLCVTLSRIQGASPQEYIMLRQKQLALAETASAMVPRKLDRQLWQSHQFGLGAPLCDIAMMSKEQNSPTLFRRGIAHIKAAVALNPGETPLGWHSYYVEQLQKTREDYEKAGLDKDVPFDSIKPAE